jgi:hypothetical protein
MSEKCCEPEKTVEKTECTCGVDEEKKKVSVGTCC